MTNGLAALAQIRSINAVPARLSNKDTPEPTVHTADT